MALVNGKKYHFLCMADESCALSAHSISAMNGANVRLGDDNYNDLRQAWTYQSDSVGFRLHFSDNDAYVLDRSDGSLSRSYNNNAHLCITSATSGTDSALVFENVSGDVYRIRLKNTINGEYLYLTAATTAGTPSATITTAAALTSAKNIYWKTDNRPSGNTTLIKRQQWKAVDITKMQKLVQPFHGKQVYTVGYENEAPAYPIEYPTYGEHHAVDLFGVNGMNIYASGNGEIVDADTFTSLGKVLAVKYNNVIDRNGYPLGSVIVRYCHLNSWESTSGIVGKDEKIAVEGASGEGAGNGKVVHLHMEVDTNINDPLSTPTEGGTNNTTINPLDVFYRTSTQTVQASCDYNPNIYSEYTNNKAWYNKSKIDNTPLE